MKTSASFFDGVVKFLLVGACFLVLAGCGSKVVETRSRVFWPPPPETPRLEWLGTYSSEDSFPKSEMQRNLESMIGKPPLTTFKAPHGIAGDSRRGIVYVADTFARDVLVYDLVNFKITSLGAKGTPVIQIPAGLALDDAGNLYVADLERLAVLVFGPDHQFRYLIGANDEFIGPTYLAVDSKNDRLYVSDSRGNKIHVYTLAGRKLETIGPDLPDGNKILNPQGLALDAAGNLYVAMQVSAKIAVVSPEGKLLRMLGERGDQVYQFEAPKTLAIDSDGNLWVGDARRPYMYTYTPEGVLLMSTGGPAPGGEAPLGFQGITGIYIDANDTVYASDRYLKRFSVWRYLSARNLAEHPLPEAAQHGK